MPGADESLTQVDRWTVPDQPRRSLQTGQRVAHIACARGFVFCEDPATSYLSCQVEHRVERGPLPSADVHRPSGGQLSWRHRSAEVGLHHVRHVSEVARLLAVPEYCHRRSFGSCLKEKRNHGGVRRERALSWSKHIEVAQRNSFYQLAARVRQHVLLAR